MRVRLHNKLCSVNVLLSISQVAVPLLNLFGGDPDNKATSGYPRFHITRWKKQPDVGSDGERGGYTTGQKRAFQTE